MFFKVAAVVRRGRIQDCQYGDLQYLPSDRSYFREIAPYLA